MQSIASTGAYVARSTSTLSSSASSSSLASSPTSPTTSNTLDTHHISSRISLRHGISMDRLKLLTDSPPETKLTNMSCGPKERSRTTIVDNETGVEVEKHSDLWFADGSVICRAENVLFCVHMSQLARHSLVFHDMFMLPQPDSDVSHQDSSLLLREETPRTKTMTGVLPMVYLYDAAEDVANLFTSLLRWPVSLTRFLTCFGNNGENDFHAISGILRLSTKYLIDSLRAKALMHLAKAWPNDLRAWDTREDLARHSEGSTRVKYPHPACIISLARDVDAPSLLPAAFYDLSRNSFAQIYEPNEEDALYRPNSPPPLSFQDTQRLCLGKEHAQQAITTLIQNMGSGHYFRSVQKTLLLTQSRRLSCGLICVSAAACRKDFAELVNLATQHYLFDRERGYCDPLYVAEELGQLKSAEFSECKACANALESWAARERERIWKMIPDWFRLESLGLGSPTPN